MSDAENFAAYRGRLLAVAYRMLGRRADAEDAVQEAWLRYAAATADPGGEPIADVGAWLTTVTARICLDMLRSARVRRETHAGQWLPEPLVERLPEPLGGAAATASDPAETVARTDEVSFALLVVLETLNPEQRVAFVLHDVFAVPFDEIARVLGTSPANARQIASRARRAVVRGERRHTADRDEQRRVLAAFLAAAGGGDIDALLRLLAPEVVMIGDGGRTGLATATPIVGSLRVARFLRGLFRQARREGALVEPVLVNGDLGLLIQVDEGRWSGLRAVMAFTVDDGRITAVFDQLDPAKLTAVPQADPARADPARADPARADPARADPAQAALLAGPADANRPPTPTTIHKG